MRTALLTLALAAPLVLAAAPGHDQDPLRPAPQHELLRRRVGTWEVRLFAPDGAGGRLESRGTLTVRALAEFHTVEDFEGDLFGQPLVGHGVNSWCPIRGRFLSTWTDSMTPAPMLLSGEYDAERRELSMSGECYGMSGTLEPCRVVTSFRDEDHIAWALHGAAPGGGEELRLSMELRRVR